MMDALLGFGASLVLLYIYSCFDNWIVWFRYERDLPVEYQRHSKWWRWL